MCSPLPTRFTSTSCTTDEAHLDGLAARMEDRTVTINGMSKTYSVTGWRVGWTIAPPRITDAIRKVHDFLTVGAPAPLQEAGASALSLPESYYRSWRKDIGSGATGWCRRWRRRDFAASCREAPIT